VVNIIHYNWFFCQTTKSGGTRFGDDDCSRSRWGRDGVVSLGNQAQHPGIPETLRAQRGIRIFSTSGFTLGRSCWL